jgi:ectoine hydroxylase-related dioxygenase (phytanoyl-CoA dioxygenase family)
MAVRTRLSARERVFLQEQGYLVVRRLVGEDVLGPVRDRLERLVAETVAAWADDPSLDIHEACVLASFDVTDQGLVPFHQHPLVTQAAGLVLGDAWQLRELDLRAPIPGAGEQGLHQDYEERWAGGPWRTLSAMWCITPFTRDSGPLRVIPGSHRRSEPPIDTEHGYATGMGPHPDEVKIIAPAGTLILFDAADLWHSGTFNYTPWPRLALTVHIDPVRGEVT